LFECRKKSFCFINVKHSTPDSSICSAVKSRRPGTKGSTKGSPGYVPGEWREAVRAATQSYYQTSGKTPSQATIKRRELGTIPQRLKGQPEQDTLYRGYKRQLEDLKTSIGKPVYIKAVQPR